jgi:D-sedoheptulose 7-phosphate isomerase
MNYRSIIAQELEEAARLLQQFLQDETTAARIEQAAHLMSDRMAQGNKIFSCGNGGSHCDAMHFAEELSGRYRHNRKALPALCISDASHISCVANDFGFEFVFSRYLEGLGRTGDVLLAISTSGNSPNIIRAAETARSLGMQVVALTGKDGGKLAPLANVEIRVPHHGFADRIQEVHIKIIHILILLIEKRLT